MISKIFRVLFSFNKKFFTMTVLSVIFSGCLFLVTAAKLVNKLQFRNMKVSAFVFRKEAKKKKLSCAALRWVVCGLLYVAVSARGLYYNMATHQYTSPFKSTYFE